MNNNNTDSEFIKSIHMQSTVAGIDSMNSNGRVNIFFTTKYHCLIISLQLIYTYFIKIV